MWTLETLQKHISTNSTEINGKWVPARPINWKYRNISQRFKEALMVFTGRADIFLWPENQ